MGFREVSVVEVKEVLRLWRQGQGVRGIARLAGVDRKTVRRYLAAAAAAGLVRAQAGELTDGHIGAVVRGAKAARVDSHGETWAFLTEHREFLDAKIKLKLRLTKVQTLLTRHTGVLVPYATLYRFAAAEFDFGRDRTTVRVADCEPGAECQVDYGRMGLVPDLAMGRSRVAWALIFTAVYSRHAFVWLTYRQTLEATIAGFDAAWAFFGGVFRVVIPDNLKAIVTKADPLNPRLNPAFVDYAQARGFAVDPARIRKATDKPRVERTVPFVRESFFRGESFRDLPDAQARAAIWCAREAGLRIHRTTQRRPAEVFDAEERAHLLPAPIAAFDVPIYADPKVHRDFHIEVARALYSVPHALVGERVRVRADSHLVKVFHRGELVKVHPRAKPGGRQTDDADYPVEKAAYAMRDIDHLRRVARSHGCHVGDYADRLLAGPLPWTKMRQVYRLLSLARRYGAPKVDTACARSLELDVVDVGRIARMLDRALEGAKTPPRPLGSNVVPLRFARAREEFTRRGSHR